MTIILPVLFRSLETSAAFAAGLLVSSVWKGGVLVACIGLLLRAIPRLSATARSVIWTAVLLAVVLFPFLSLRPGSGTLASPHNMVHAGAAWSLLIAGAWAVLSLLRLGQLAASALRLRSVARKAVPLAASEMREGIAALLGGSRRRIQLCVSADVSRPSVAGFLHPCILLPLGMLDELSVPELEHVVVHEMEHLRRHDDWTNLLQKLSLAFFSLHPALLWLDRRLCVERELACDDGVVRVTHARKAYAACLARLAEDAVVRRGLSLALGLLGSRSREPGRSELSRRVHRILRGSATAMGRAQVVVASAVLLAGIIAGSALLARSPQFISFGAGSQTSNLEQASGQLAGVPLALAMKRASAGQMPHETLVKAVLSEPALPGLPRLRVNAASTRRTSPSTRRFSSIRRVTFAPRQRASVSPYVVSTEWHSMSASAHMTLAVAQYLSPPAAAPAVPQQVYKTYAAVPVQGGWLLIQL